MNYRIKVLFSVCYTAHLPAPRSVRLVPSGEVKFFFPVTKWENHSMAGKKNQNKTKETKITQPI